MSSRVILEGSEKAPLAEAKLSPANENEEVTFTLELRRKEHPQETPSKPMARTAYFNAHGAEDDDIKAVKEVASEYNFEVVEASATKRLVQLRGKLADVEKAFNPNVQNAEINGVKFRQRSGAITLPEKLAGRVVAVIGIDNRPQAKPRLRLSPMAAPRSMTPLEVAALYKFPAGDGAGSSIAIIELGGGFLQSDVNQYFTSLHLPVPRVTAVSIGGAQNNPGLDPNADSEVALDIQVAGAVAPKADMFVYFAPNTDQGFVNALASAIHDQTPPPTSISISWGAPEDGWTAQAKRSFDRFLQDAAHVGIPVFVASGDNGSTDGTSHVVVDFPAASPNAIACGGTRLEGAHGSIINEVVWNSQGSGSGGGVSKFFAKPAYQNGITTPTNGSAHQGRGVPDVAGNADPATGYEVLINGQAAVIGGTSAVAPLWAGLIARIAAGRTAGFLQTKMYQRPTAFKDITSGSNDVGNGGGKYSATAGWDPCTGLGTPIGDQIATLIP